ncbi:hypothetical protein AAE478_000034 [Parahypoxylon ruwenzoriense]
MKTVTVLTSLLLFGASAVSAAPVTERQVQKPTEFDITNFSANTQPHGDGAFISFNLAVPGTSTSTQCGYSDSSSISALPSVPMRPCDDPAVEWQFRQDPSVPGTEGRYRIVVTYAYGEGNARVAGFHEWPATDFPLESFGSTVETFYRGQPDFVIDNLS